MPITYIDNKSALSGALTQINEAPRIAIDLEFDKNYHRYGFNICLIQIFDGKSCFLIDPLSEQMDFKNLFPALENPDIEKVTFAFGEDLRLLHSLGCFPKNIFDLDIATSLLNYPPASLTNLIQDVLNVDTGKSSQLSNWFKRPLTDEQIHYAAQDVLHLFDLKSILDEQADKKNIIRWIKEENSDWDELDYSNKDNNGIYKEKEKKDFSEVEWHIYKALLHFREEIAETYDKPTFQVIKKEYLMDIAKDSRVLMNWHQAKGIFRKIKNDETKSAILDVIKSAREDADKMGLSENEPAIKPPSAEELALYRENQKHLKKMRSVFFDPIKKKIEAEYGENTATYMLSNRIISDIIFGNNGKLKSYKRELFLSYADELGLNTDILMEIVEAG